MLFVPAPSALHRRSVSRPALCARPRCGTGTPVGRRVVMSASSGEKDSGDEYSMEEELAKLESMRNRLEGLFGQDDESKTVVTKENFDGKALRQAIVNRWGVQYDVQPTKFHNRVYVQIMWRYFEQQSFYMDEEEFSSHCEAVAILLNRWNAVEHFLDYIANIKKRPVVGITVNIPIPNLDASETPFEV